LAKSKSQEKQIRSGLEALRRAGVAVDDPSPFLVQRLRDHFGKDPQMDLAVVFTLGRIAEAAAVEALEKIENDARDKVLRKEIRRSLFKLSQKGLTVPEARTSDSTGVTSLLKSASDVEAYMSAVDGAGGRLLWIVKPQAGHGLQTIQAMLSDREGLLRLGGAQIRRKELRNMGRKIKDKHGIEMISLPWEYADQTLYAAYEKPKPKDGAALKTFMSCAPSSARASPSSKNIRFIAGSMPTMSQAAAGANSHGVCWKSRNCASGFLTRIGWRLICLNSRKRRAAVWFSIRCRKKNGSPALCAMR
jgi:hypothetical protein